MTPHALRERAAEIARARAFLSDFVDYGDVADVETAYAIQDALAALEGPVGGYKISWNRPELQSKFGVTAPGAARILKRRILQDASVLSAADFSVPMLEPEIAAVLASDIPIEAQTSESVAPYVAYLVPAFELLDRRNVASANGLEIIAQGVFNAGVVLGTPSGGQIGESYVRVGDVVHCNGADAAPEPPLQALAYLATLYAARGVQLCRGDVIMCGSHTPLLPIHPGEGAVMSITGLGQVTLSLTP